MVRLVSLGVLLLLIVVLGLTFFHVLAPFLLPLFLAGVFTILCQPLQRHFVARCNDRHHVAAAVTTGTVMAVILVPLITATILASLQLFVVSTEFGARDWRKRLSSLEESVRQRTESAVEWATGMIDRQLPPDEARTPEDVERIVQMRVRELLTDASGRSLGMAGKTLEGTFDLLSTSVVTVISFLMQFLIFVVALYYFLADGPELLAASERLIPVNAAYQRELIDQFAKVVRSVVTATFLCALLQALATTIILGLLGFPHLIILFLVCLMAAMIPLVGTWPIWGPCALWLFWTGHWIQGTFLLVYGTAFVGLMDNVVRTHVLKNDTALHPLLAFISVLGGLQTMGLWGVFIGPIVASCLHALAKIFNLELSEVARERLVTSGAGGEAVVSLTAPTSRQVGGTIPTSPPAGDSEDPPIAAKTGTGQNEKSGKRPQKRIRRGKKS